MLAIALVLTLLGCEHRVTAYPQQAATTTTGAVRYAYINITWISSIDEIPQDSRCNKHGKLWYGCAKPVIAGDVGHCDVWALKPTDFNDVVRLTILGHEVWHCLGADHG